MRRPRSVAEPLSSCVVAPLDPPQPAPNRRPTAQTPAAVFAAARQADPARPFVTYYDDATGERVELSLASVDNWVAKTANLLQDGLATVPGERVALLLPTHWLGAVWMLAAWLAGLVVDLDDPTGAEVVVAGPDALDRAGAAGGRDTVALTLLPLGGRFTDPLPAGVLDYGVEVPGHADAFVPYEMTGPDTDALVAGGSRVTGRGLVARADARADELGLATGDRLMTDTNPAGSDGHLDALLSPLLRRASVVLLRRPDVTVLARRAAEEKVTVQRLAVTPTG